MAREFSRKFYDSADWRKTRAAYVKSVSGLCEICTEEGKVVPGKVLHHKTELNPYNINDPDITLGWDNLQYVCQTHHNKIHHEKYSPVRSDVMFDSEGNLIRRES
jgi:5-methylcytosine-specific restriction enzyme A